MKYLFTALACLICIPSFAAVSNWIEFENRNGHIAIPVILAGKPATAILDSGSEVNGISTAFLEAHPDDFAIGRAVRVSGVYGSAKTNALNGVPLTLFGVNFDVDSVIPLGIGSIDFLIGQPFFENFIVQIDYPNNRMRIMDRDSLNLKKIDNVKMKRMRGAEHPVVRVDINGEYKPWLILDTGSNGGMSITRHRAEKRGWLERFAVVEGQSTGVTETAAIELFRVPEVSFGPYTLENVLVSVPAAGQETNLTRAPRQEWSTGSHIRSSEKKSAEGILGYDVLQHFVLTIDYKRNLLHIAESAE